MSQSIYILWYKFPRWNPANIKYNFGISSFNCIVIGFPSKFQRCGALLDINDICKTVQPEKKCILITILKVIFAVSKSYNVKWLKSTLYHRGKIAWSVFLLWKYNIISLSFFFSSPFTLFRLVFFWIFWTSKRKGGDCNLPPSPIYSEWNRTVRIHLLIFALLFFAPRGYMGFYWLNHTLLKKKEPTHKWTKNIKHISHDE